MTCEMKWEEPVRREDLTFLDIEIMAERVARDYDFDRNKESVRVFAERLGGRIEITDMPSAEEYEGGSLYVDGPRHFRIFLSPYTGVLRDNFTIAHELGHYFLHSGQPAGSLRIRAYRSGMKEVEWQANRFAAGLLMPREEFVRLSEVLGNDKAVLAGTFKVSIAAVESRLKSLGLVSDAGLSR